MTSPLPPQASRTRAWIGGAVVGAIALVALGSVLWQRDAAPPPPAPRPALSLPLDTAKLDPGRPSIAVLAFVSDDPGQAYLGDGIAEDLITDLAKLTGLVVIARQSSFAYKSRGLGPIRIGRELGVRFVISGAARQAGDRIHIAVDVRDVASGASIWAERFDQSHDELPDLLRQTRQGIVTALAVPLTPSEQARWSRSPTMNVVAYESWVQGLDRWNSVTKDTHQEAQHMFARSVEVDPGFARAWGRLARTYLYAIDQGWSDSVDPDLRRSVGLAQRAADLDPGQRDAGYVLSRVHLFHRDYAKALAELQRIVTLNPNFADGYVFIGETLIYAGYAGEAIAYVEHATRINPKTPASYRYVLGHAQFVLGRYREAAANLEDALALQPDSLSTRRMLIAAYGQLGQTDVAAWELAELRKAGSAPTLRTVRQTMPYRDPLARERVLDGLRAAGVPDQ